MKLTLHPACRFTLNVRESGFTLQLHAARPRLHINLQARQGPPGRDALRYRHDQTSAAAEWIINHNFGYPPVIDVFTLGGVRIWPEVQHYTTNQARILHVSPQAGYAICI